MKKVHSMSLQLGRLVGIVWLCILSTALSAQNFTEYNWLFGDQEQHIQFLKGSDAFDLIDTTGIRLGDKGASVATDGKSGELLMFTDGRTIYDASYQPMAGMVGSLNGDTLANQETVIIPVTDVMGRYFVIYKTSVGQLEYAEVDMTQTGNGTVEYPLGRVLTTNQSFVTDTVGAMTTMQGSSSGPNYLIYQSLTGNNDLVSVEIDALNFPPVGTIINTPLPNAPFIAQSLTYSNIRNRLIMSPATANTNVHLFLANTSSGTFTFLEDVLNSGFSDGIGANVYDAAFSPSGRFLYISRGGNGSGTGNIFQYDIDSGGSAASVLPSTVARSYGLKLGPDGNIYHLFQQTGGGDFQLGRLTDTDSLSALVGYEVVDEGGITNWGAEQFPEIAGAQPVEVNLSFTMADTCSGGTTKFFAESDPPALSYFWSFDSAGTITSTAVSPIVEFPDPGDYEVTLMAEIPGVGMQSFTRMVNIIDNSQNTISLGNDTTICPGETLVLELEDPNNSIVPGSEFWSEIDSATNMPFAGTTLSVTDAGTYWVRAEFTNGCIGSGSIRVEIFNEQEQTSNYWDFGFNVEINFNEDPPVVSSNNVMVAPEGSATISNAAGDKQLFSDGDLVYARNNTIMEPGLPIGGNLTATQSVAIVPFQSSQDIDIFYYVFTTHEVDSGTYELAYSVVDLRGGDALGEVLTQGTNRTIFTRATERLSVVNINGSQTVVTHEYGTNSLVGFPVTQNGIEGPIYVSGGSIHSRANPDEAEGYLEFNGAGDKVAMALKTASANTVEVFDFDQEELSLTNELVITLPDPVATSSVYGLEFSSGGSKLFISIDGDPSRIYEVRIDSPDQDFAQASLTQISLDADGAGLRFGAIQVAPSGQTLVAINNSGTLGMINVSEDTVVSTFTRNGFSLASVDGSVTASRMGLPNFIQSSLTPITPPTMSTEDGCLGNVLTFTGSATSQLDTLTWFFGDGNFLIGDTATHQYALAGDYLVTLEITNRCGLDTALFDTVTVYQQLPLPTIPSDTAICGDPISLNAADGSNGAVDPTWTYNWSTGETTPTISISSLTGTSQLFTVTVTDTVGCTISDSTLVSDGRPVFDLGTNQTVCEGTPVPDLDAALSGPLFSWTLNGANTGNTTRLQPVNTGVVDTLIYTLTVNDTLTGCSNADTVTYVVNANPVISATSTATTDCGLSNGSATVMVTSPMNYVTLWEGLQNAYQGNTDATGLVLDAGLYSVTVTDAVTACSASETVSVVDGGDDFAITNVITDVGCVTSSVQLQVNDSISTGTAVDVWIQNLTDGTPPSNISELVINLGVSTRGFDLSGLTPGDYLVQLVNPSMCVQDTTFTIADLPDVSIDAPTFIDACGSTTTVSVDVSGLADPEVLWTAFNGGGFPVSEDITQPTVTVDAAGLYLVTVADSASGLCPATDTITVNLNSFPAVTINTIGENCEGQYTLGMTTAPDGNYSAVWTFNDNQVGIGESIVATESGRYEVTASLQTTGCSATDFITIAVNDPLSVQAIGEPACDDGNPIQLTAIAEGTSSDSLLYTWRGPGQISGTFNTNTIDVFEPGTYTIQVRRNMTPTDGCIAEDRIEIERIPFDTVTATVLGVVCPQDPDPSVQSVDLEAMGDFVTYTWIFPDSSRVGGAVLNTSTAGFYAVIGQDAFGCVDTAYSEVREFCEVYVRAPTAFKPGSPAGNGTYGVIYRNIQEGSFRALIYNRWGTLIRQFNDPDFTWDGRTVNGDLAPSGSYVVVFQYQNATSDDNEVQEERTRVVLLR